MKKEKCIYCGSDMTPTGLATPTGRYKGAKCYACEYEYSYHTSAPDEHSIVFPSRKKLREALKKKEGTINVRP